MPEAQAPAETAAFHTIVVCTDGTPFSMRAVEVAFRLARRDRAKIIVVAVVDTSVMLDFAGQPAKQLVKVEHELEYNAEKALAAVGERAAALGVDCEMIIKKGRPHIEIVMAASHAEADLVVMGKRSGYRTGRNAVGGVTRRVIEDADCSVLIVP
jgi:nucleotide-binding universal stress UspA family protein